MARSKKPQLSAGVRRAMDAKDEVARQDMAFGLCTLVRPAIRLVTGQRRAFIEGAPQRWQGGEIVVQGPEVDSDDLGVLLACAAIAVEQFDLPSTRLAPGVHSPGLVAPSRPGALNLAEELDVCTIHTTLAAVCRRLGRRPDDGRAHQSIRGSLARLASVVVIARQGDEEAFTHLIAAGASTGKHRLRVTLSFRLTGALAGTRSYGRIHMDTWRHLKPVARVVYHWLACWRPGHGRCPPIGLDALAKHVWGTTETSPALAARRRQQLRAALAELPANEWKVSVAGQLVHLERLVRLAGARSSLPDHAATASYAAYPSAVDHGLRVPEYASPCC
jgi:hypothetical protein